MLLRRMNLIKSSNEARCRNFRFSEIYDLILVQLDLEPYHYVFKITKCSTLRVLKINK